MKTKYAAIVAASISAMLVLAPGQFSARAHGTHAFHSHNHFRGARHSYDAYGSLPFYGGLDVAPPYEPAGVSYAPPPTVVYVPEPPQALSCHHSEQIVTVPGELGGTKQITVTRC